MKKYKTFNEIKPGDTLYGVNISNVSCQFKKYKVISRDDNLSNSEVIETYIDVSPLSFDFRRNRSQWHQIIFTTREEAIESAKCQINQKVKEFSEQIEYYLNIMINIDDIKFK